MSVVNRDELMNKLKARIGDDTSDEAIQLLEDVSDTIADYEEKAKGDGTDWKAESERIDKEWRERYIARFNGADGVEDEPLVPKEEPKNYTYENLFKEG